MEVDVLVLLFFEAVAESTGHKIWGSHTIFFLFSFLCVAVPSSATHADQGSTYWRHWQSPSPWHAPGILWGMFSFSPAVSCTVSCIYLYTSNRAIPLTPLFRRRNRREQGRQKKKRAPEEREGERERKKEEGKKTPKVLFYFPVIPQQRWK